MESFGEVVGHVDGGIDTFEDHEVPFYPIAEREIFYIDVPRTSGGLLGVTHCRATVVVLIQKGGGFLLWYVEVP